VPAIREFLGLNRDLDFGSVNELGYPSVRAAFLDTLQQIGGREAQGLMLETLQATLVPGEIGRLARSLEQQAPGQFRGEISAAVRETLAQAASGQLRGWDMGPLFSGIAELWRCKHGVGLGEERFGVELLFGGCPGQPAVRSRNSFADPAGSGVVQQWNAWRCDGALAQVAAQSSDATAALVQLAGSGKFSDRNWTAAAQALGGDRYFIRDTGLDNAQVPTGSGVKSYHLELSNQNFYSMPALGSMSNEQINQRVAIIDQLLATNPSAAVAQTLQSTRASLLASGQQNTGP